MSLHSRSCRQTSIPGGRAAQVDDRRVRAGARRPGRAPPRPSRSEHLEAGLAQDEPQRPQDLGLVVARRGCAAGRRPAPSRALTRPGGPCVGREPRRPGVASAPRAGLERELEDEARALTRQRLDRDAATVDLDEAPRDRQPESRAAVSTAGVPGPGRRAGRSARAAPRGSPGPDRRSARSPITADPGLGVVRTNAPRGAGETATARARTETACPRVAAGVLEHVRRRPARAGTGSPRRSGRSRPNDRLNASVPRADLLDRLPDQLLDRVPAPSRGSAARPPAARGRAGCRPGARAAWSPR